MRSAGSRTVQRGHAFPHAPAEMSVQWLGERLRTAGVMADSDRIRSISSQPVGEGIGMLGVIARFEIAWEGGEGPLASVVAKFATPVVANRSLAKTFRLYEREVRFFDELRSRLPQGVPSCYAAEIDVETGDFVLLLEDLVGYRMGDQTDGCSVADAELCLDVVAPLHAAWWGAPQRSELDWVWRIDSAAQVQGMVAGFEAGWQPTITQFGDVIPAAVLAAGDDYLAALPSLHARMGADPLTLVHGDFRLDNLMFGTERSHHPLMLLDWQGMAVSRGVHDVAYLLTQNIGVDTRRNHERRLVERYHGRLVEAGVEGYSADRCWEDYRLAALWMLEYAVVIAGTLEPGNDRGRLLMKRLVERSATTIDDLGLLELIR